MKNKDLLDFIAELGLLKRVKRSGWWVLGVPYEESVAEHSFRCAAIGYLLAQMEGADPYKVLMMTLFGDIHEARICDLHKISQRYLDISKAESKAYNDEIKKISSKMRKQLEGTRKEYDSQRTLEAHISRDADILECLIQAKEYVDLGFRNAGKFFLKSQKYLKTQSARALWKSAKKWDSTIWWQKLDIWKK